MTDIGVGMLGYAFMGKAHSNAFKKIPYITWPPPLVPRLVGIAGRNEEAVGEAATGEEGVRAARRLRPDLVLMDVHLPDIDGYEAARRIAPFQPETVIVLVSAAADVVVGDMAAMSGASEFVRKEELCSTLLRQLWDRHHVEVVAPE